MTMTVLTTAWGAQPEPMVRKTAMGLRGAPCVRLERMPNQKTLSAARLVLVASKRAYTRVITPRVAAMVSISRKTYHTLSLTSLELPFL